MTSFVREHVVARTDSLQMLAVRHGVSVPCLKRVNNLMSDHALHSRTQLYIPGAGGLLYGRCGHWWTSAANGGLGVLVAWSVGLLDGCSCRGAWCVSL